MLGGGGRGVAGVCGGTGMCVHACVRGLVWPAVAGDGYMTARCTRCGSSRDLPALTLLLKEAPVAAGRWGMGRLPAGMCFTTEPHRTGGALTQPVRTGTLASGMQDAYMMPKRAGSLGILPRTDHRPWTPSDADSSLVERYDTQSASGAVSSTYSWSVRAGSDCTRDSPMDCGHCGRTKGGGGRAGQPGGARVGCHVLQVNVQYAQPASGGAVATARVLWRTCSSTPMHNAFESAPFAVQSGWKGLQWRPTYTGTGPCPCGRLQPAPGGEEAPAPALSAKRATLTHADDVEYRMDTAGLP